MYVPTFQHVRKLSLCVSSLQQYFKCNISSYFLNQHAVACNKKLTKLALCSNFHETLHQRKLDFHLPLPGEITNLFLNRISTNILFVYSESKCVTAKSLQPLPVLENSTFCNVKGNINEVWVILTIYKRITSYPLDSLIQSWRISLLGIFRSILRRYYFFKSL